MFFDIMVYREFEYRIYNAFTVKKKKTSMVFQMTLRAIFPNVFTFVIFFFFLCL